MCVVKMPEKKTPVSSRSFVDKSQDAASTPDCFRSLGDKFIIHEVKARKILKDSLELLHQYEERKLDDTERFQDSNNLSDLLDELKSVIYVLKSIADDAEFSSSHKTSTPRSTDQANQFRLNVSGLQASYRKILLEFQKVSSRKDRQSLFSMSTSPFDDKVRKRMTKANEISANTTKSLSNSRKILADTVLRSGETLHNLASSSHQVTNTKEDLHNQMSELSIARKVLGKYGRREFTDKMLIWVGLLFFFACVLYVGFKRLF